MGVVGDDSDTEGKFQELLELEDRGDLREQHRHSDWNPGRGSRNQVPRGWESVGDYGVDGDECDESTGGVVIVE